MQINTPNDMITLRFLLSMSTKQLAKELHVSFSTVENIERLKKTPSRVICLAMRTICERAPHSSYLKTLYAKINSKEYVNFLYSCTKSGNMLPKMTLYKCGCSKPQVEFTWKSGLNYPTLSASCNYCGFKADCWAFGQLRHQLLVNDNDFDPFWRGNYDSYEWKNSKERKFIGEI